MAQKLLTKGRTNLAHPHTQQAPNEIARLILYFFPSALDVSGVPVRASFAVLVRNAVFQIEIFAIVIM